MSDVLTYEALKAERDHFQQINEQTLQVKLQMAETIKELSDRVIALAVENAALKKAVTEFNELYGQGMSVANWHLNGDLEPLDNFFDENDWNPETPSTDAALAAIRAQAVEDAVKQVISVDTIASTAVISYLLRAYAAELREAK